ncbi:MAG: hypothetical protein IKZ59_03485 [Clostridia bacterium]|nr:hypothetical protein [Clostridia bacterium]
MNIEYYIADPAGNITALVTSDVSRDLYKSVSGKIMEKRKNVEQVGFTDFRAGAAKLNMSGDEFCGNAAMSAAALYGVLTGKSGSFETEIKVSGAAKPVKTAVREKDGFFECRCEIERPEKISETVFSVSGREYRFPLVSFEGISHIVADGSLSEADAESVIKKLAGKLKVKALGIMIVSDKTGMRPIVYVPGVNTLFYENSCASGSCAVASVLCGPGEEAVLKQPGGEIRVRNAEKLELFGKIKLSKCYSEEL